MLASSAHTRRKALETRDVAARRTFSQRSSAHTRRKALETRTRNLSLSLYFAVISTHPPKGIGDGELPGQLTKGRQVISTHPPKGIGDLQLHRSGDVEPRSSAHTRRKALETSSRRGRCSGMLAGIKAHTAERHWKPTMHAIKISAHRDYHTRRNALESVNARQ